MIIIDYAPVLLWTCFALTGVYSFYSWFEKNRKQQQFMHAHNCQPSYRCHPVREPFTAADVRYKIIKAATQHKLLDFWRGLQERFDYTYTTTSFAETSINSAEPENAKAVYSTNFADWSVAPGRQSFKFALGDSIFMVDGPAWSHSRALIRPIFMRDHVANLGLLEDRVQALLHHIPKDGSTVDLQPLFIRLALDASTGFVFGQSTDTLRPNQSDAQSQLHADFDLIMADAVDRIRFGKLYPLLKNNKAAAALRNVHSKAEEYGRKALEKSLDEKESESTQSKRENYSFLDELAKQTGDTAKMRDEAVTLLFAGRDTTASLLSHLWYLLARNPSVWRTLLEEVDQLQGALPDYEWIKNAKYIRHCEHEAMRLYPAIPQFPPRVANKDTMIPVGGGPDGKSPLFVAKGSKFNFSPWTANRRKDIWGDDAEDFKPSRWDSVRPGWAYIPFGGGPRSCIGQQFALIETYYVTVRLMQLFRRVESRDDEPWVEQFTTTLCSQNGVKVGLFAE